MELSNKLTAYWQLAIVFCLIALISFTPDFAVAADDGITCVLYTIQTKLTGTIGKGIATIAIVVLGIGLFLGKLSWGLAIATGIGIGMIFSASSIVTWLSSAKDTAAVSCT